MTELGEGKFDDPTDIAFNHNHVYVLDNSGTRVQILDSEGAFQCPASIFPVGVQTSGSLGTTDWASISKATST